MMRTQNLSKKLLLAALFGIGTWGCSDPNRGTGGSGGTAASPGGSSASPSGGSGGASIGNGGASGGNGGASIGNGGASSGGNGGARSSGETTGSGGARGTSGPTTGTGGASNGSGGDGSGGASTGAGGSGNGGASTGTGGAVTSGTQGRGGSGGVDAGSSQGGARGGTSTDPGVGTGGTVAYNPCTASTGPCKILPLGDSITYGDGSTKVDGGTETYSGGYRVELFTRAMAANQRITFIGSKMNGPATVAGKSFPRNSEGYPGYVIDQIAKLVPSPALDGKPDIILLLIGTNDMYQGDVPAAPDRLAKLMDKILAADTHALLVVSAITPWAAQGTKIPTYNNAIPPLVEARAAAGKHIKFADVTAGWNSNTMFGDDKLHPNWTGYNLMGDLWYKAVGNLFPN